MPRLCVASLTEQIRLHSGRFRSASCRTLGRRLDQIVAEHATPNSPLKRRALLLHQHIAQAFAAIAEQDWRAANHALAFAQEGSEVMKLGAVGVDLMALRAFVQDRLGESSTALLREAMDLGTTYGMSLTTSDLHPAFAEWLHERGGDGAPRVAAIARQPPATGADSPASGPDAGPRVISSAVLTPKERFVLELASRNLTNKEIALAMGVGQETVKWHMKNLFIKLDATSRRQIVRRAQLMGLLQEPA
jgi:LuxR family maltose regulon positive regulatory protein